MARDDDPASLARTADAPPHRCPTRVRAIVMLALSCALLAACAGDGGWPRLAGPLPQADIPPPPVLVGDAPRPIVAFPDRRAAESWVAEAERRIDAWEREIAGLSVRELPPRIRPDDLKLWGEAESRLTRLHRIEAELLEADLKREAAERRLVERADDAAAARVWRARLARLADRLHRMEATVATHRRSLEARLDDG